MVKLHITSMRLGAWGRQCDSRIQALLDNPTSLWTLNTHTHTHTDRQTDRHTHTHTHRQTDTHTHTQTDRQTHTQTDTHTHTHTHTASCCSNSTVEKEKTLITAFGDSKEIVKGKYEPCPNQSLKQQSVCQATHPSSFTKWQVLVQK